MTSGLHNSASASLLISASIGNEQALGSNKAARSQVKLTVQQPNRLTARIDNSEAVKTIQDECTLAGTPHRRVEAAATFHATANVLSARPMFFSRAKSSGPIEININMLRDRPDVVVFADRSIFSGSHSTLHVLSR